MANFKLNHFKKLLFFPLLIILLVQCNSQSHKSGTEKSQSNPAFEADVDIELIATSQKMQLVPGEKTNVYTYISKLIKGEDENLEKLPDTYLGPTIRVKPGQKIRVRFKNQLPDESIIHWHGLHISPEMDGHPMYAIDKGEEYIYEFTVNNRPGTYWYHPHPDKITGPQVYYGLAGMFIVEEENENLPAGDYDMPLVLQDRKLDNNNQLVYIDDSRRARMRGFYGNQMFVNGKPNREMEVKQGDYRLRVLNGSNARIYKLAWSDGNDVIAIGTDGGLLEKPIKKPYIMLAPGERIDIWKHFGKMNKGEEVILKSLSFDPGTTMGMGGMMGGRMDATQGIENGEEMDLFSFQFTGGDGFQKELPVKLSQVKTIEREKAVNAENPRRFHFTFEHMEWVINGETFGMTEVADWEKVKLNTTEIWEFINGDDGDGMGMMGDMMQMPHPVHMHGLQFQVIDRDISGVDPASWRTVKDGFMDKGWQDTFLLLPGMKVQVIMRFLDFTGIYVYHCHNLEHEDMGMMRNFEVINQ